jgi:hypothetical protein
MLWIMPTDPLFALLPGSHGPLRRLLAEQTGGRDLPGDLLHVVESLADRIDAANAAGAYRGFVMLTAEYRAARAELLGDQAPADDPLSDLVAQLMANDDDADAATAVRDPAE